MAEVGGSSPPVPTTPRFLEHADAIPKPPALMSDIQVGLPDGRTLTVPAGASVLEVAEKIGKGLARAALAGRVDGKLVDLRLPLHQHVSLQIVTDRDPAAGEVIRHSAEHVMADAVKRLFPSAQVDVGRTDHSEKFQYDFQVERAFTPEDLERIEAEMRRIIAEKPEFTREVVSRAEAKRRFEALGEKLKLSRLDDIPEGQDITLFRHGDFVDLCRGPHVRHAGQIGAVKLLEAAGAYWRGDERNPMLQRIYGTAFASQAALDEHLRLQEELLPEEGHDVFGVIRIERDQVVQRSRPFAQARKIRTHSLAKLGDEHRVLRAIGRTLGSHGVDELRLQLAQRRERCVEARFHRRTPSRAEVVTDDADSQARQRLALHLTAA